jgi:hypothetical protein
MVSTIGTLKAEASDPLPRASSRCDKSTSCSRADYSRNLAAVRLADEVVGTDDRHCHGDARASSGGVRHSRNPALQ